MSKFVINSETIIAIADAIRRKTGKLLGLSPAEMPGEIDGIMTGFNTADATAVSANILEGISAYNGTGKIWGSMLNRNVVGHNGVIGHSPTNPNLPLTLCSEYYLAENADGGVRLTARVPQGYYQDWSFLGIGFPIHWGGTYTPQTWPQTIVSGGTYCNSDITIDAIPGNYKQVQTTSGSFTTDRNGNATVNLGFRPDVVRFAINHTWNGYSFETAADFTSANTNKIICADLYDDDSIFVALYVLDRTDTGFTIAAEYRDYSLNEKTLKNKTITYSAVKYT